MPRFFVRRIARGGALAAALLFLGLPNGCDTDPVGPDKGKAVWIGQSVSGRVAHSVLSTAIAGASVTFLAGLEEGALIQLGSATTNSSGNYSIVRANQTGTPADFWWFPASGQEPVTVYLALRVTRSGYVPVELRQEISRSPSTDAPSRLLENYQLQMSAALRQISEGS